jgi:hypothetical protein
MKRYTKEFKKALEIVHGMVSENTPNCRFVSFEAGLDVEHMSESSFGVSVNEISWPRGTQQRVSCSSCRSRS